MHKKKKKKQKTLDNIKGIKVWLDMRPKVPSHYCRKSTNRLYIVSTFKSKSHIYRHRVYEDGYKENQQTCASKKNIFKNLNTRKNFNSHSQERPMWYLLWIWLKKVDREPLELIYLEHCKKKDAARTEKNRLKSICSKTT